MGQNRSVKQRYEALSPFLDERQRRLMAGTEAAAIGYGGISAVSRATGVCRDTVRRGLAELNAEADEDPARVRKPGGGRKQAKDEQPGLLDALRELIEPNTRGDPDSAVRWVSKGVRKLSAALHERGFVAGRTLVGRLLKDELEFNLQANAKVLEGSRHPDRNAQFEHIADRIKEFRANNQPVISVDAKKKELIGDYKNNGREWRPKGEPELVRVHDFAGQLGKANPYGVYDIVANAGWVGVGLSVDTAAFAVETIRRWYHTVGKLRYPNMTRLFITADGGGSNGSRLRLWKTQLQELADEIGLEITVSHYPPGTSKWNRIEHSLFAFITMNWRARPLTSYMVIVQLIAATTTVTGLTVACELDTNTYQKGIKVTAAQLASINISYDQFHPDWNYTISPSRPSG
jgi:Rhodopirellula transposase DDE domain